MLRVKSWMFEMSRWREGGGEQPCLSTGYFGGVLQLMDSKTIDVQI